MPDAFASAFARLRAAFAVHPHGPTEVSEAVAADLAALSRRRARWIAWVGLASVIPALYVDHWVPYQAGLWAENPGYHVGVLVWRFASGATLAAWLWLDRRAPAGAGPDTRLAAGFGVLGIAQTAWFGVWFVDNPPSYPMFSFLLLMLAFLLHPPSRWMIGAYAAAAPVALGGALLYGTPSGAVVEWTAPYVLSVVLVILVDRLLYQRVYQGFEAEHLLGRANAELSATLAELRQTQARLLDAERRAERLRISRDLHDSVGAQLSSLLAGVELARLEHGAGRGPAASGTLDEVEADAREALQQLRETVWALNSEALTVDGLADQLRRFAASRSRRTPVAVAVTVEGDAGHALSSAQALHLYRIGQEAVQNAVKHSGAGAVSVRLAACEGRLELAVQDDGRFRPPVPPAVDGAPAGFGMHTMRERAEALGATFSMDTERGTRVSVSVPRDPAL